MNELDQIEKDFLKRLLPQVQATGRDRIIIEKILCKIDPEYSKLWENYDADKAQ